jgi:hypothetical protein
VLRIFTIFILLLGLILGFLSFLTKDKFDSYTTVSLTPDKPTSNEDTARKETTKPSTLGDLADGVYTFLVTTFEKDNEIYLSKKCSFDKCTVTTPAHLPGRAWYLMSHARAGSLANDSDAVTANREEAKNRFTTIFREWIQLADRKSEVYSLHQLFSAYRVHQDTTLLRWFYSRIPFLESYVKTNILTAGTAKTMEPYLTMALARQFANGALILLDDDLAKKAFENKKAQEHKNKNTESFIMLSEILIKSFSNNKNPVIADEPPLFEDVVPGSDNKQLHKIPQFACFKKWAEVSLLEAYQKEEKYSQKKQELEKEIFDFFSMFNELERAGNTFNFSTLQSVLSCVHAISDLKSIVPGFPESLDIRSELLLKYIVPQGDYSKENDCQGDGGFFSTFESKTDVGCQRVKSIVDNSWLYFLIDEELRKVEIVF